MYAGGTLSNNTYKWYKDQILIATRHGDSTFTPAEDGRYYVAVTNSIVTELTLYSDTVNFTKTTLVAENNIDVTRNNLGVLIYPNPVKDIATIRFNVNGNYSIKITDVSGNTLQTKTGIRTMGDNIIKLDVHNYAAGIYFVILSDEKNQIKTLRLNKQ